MRKNNSQNIAAVKENKEPGRRPARRTIDAETASRMAEICTDYNGTRNDKRNFRCMEFSGMTFSGQGLSGIEAHYSKFKDVLFEECDLSRMEGYFAEIENCRFVNCNLQASNFSFAVITGVEFIHCDLDGVDMPFAKGDFRCENCMMQRFTAQNAELKISLTETNAAGAEANSACIEIEASRSNLRRSEFNDGRVKGTISQTDLTNSEFNRSDLTDLQLVDCATRNMETEGSAGCENSDSDLDDIFNDDDEE